MLPVSFDAVAGMYIRRCTVCLLRGGALLGGALMACSPGCAS